MPTSPFNQGPNINNAIELKLLIINAIRSKLLIINAIIPMLLFNNWNALHIDGKTYSDLCWGHIPYSQPNVDRFVFCNSLALQQIELIKL